jgi:hypothetical protein
VSECHICNSFDILMTDDFNDVRMTTECPLANDCDRLIYGDMSCIMRNSAVGIIVSSNMIALGRHDAYVMRQRQKDIIIISTPQHSNTSSDLLDRLNGCQDDVNVFYSFSMSSNILNLQMINNNILRTTSVIV